MTGTERVVLGFITAKETRKASILLYCVKLIATTGEDLVRVSLVANVPDESVLGRVENVVHRHRELDRPERGARVPADARTSIDNELPDLVRDFLEVLDPQLPEVGR